MSEYNRSEFVTCEPSSEVYEVENPDFVQSRLPRDLEPLSDYYLVVTGKLSSGMNIRLETVNKIYVESVVIKPLNAGECRLFGLKKTVD